MLTLKIAKEIDVLAQVDDWLRRSSSKGSHQGVWGSPKEKEEHEEAIRMSKSSSLSERFPGGEVYADFLASAISLELSRLALGVSIMRRAMSRCQWPEVFESEGRSILRSVDSFSHE